MDINQDKPFSGISVKFVTPCGSASYDREYVRSFHNTACVLIELGAKIDWAEFPGCADLPLARAKLFGNFLRSGFDYMFSVDADMGWSHDDVVRMILHKKDFIAAAGRKKNEKLEFACNNCDDESNLLPIITDPETGLIECSDVGMAFAMISKNCAQKMAAAYPELIFDGDEKTLEYDLFHPMIIGTAPKRRRLSEDFAFCHRWRAIGGKIYLMPDVVLQHAGRAVWTGALIESLMGKPL